MTDWHAEIDVQLGRLELSVQLSGDHAPLALVGPNGSGKTTLLRIIAGALRPERGKIQVGEAVLFDSATSVDLPPEARSVGYVPQGYGLFPHLSALDNVAFGLSLGSAAKGRGARRSAALEMLKTLECEDLALRLPRRLSGGEQQRVALARALLMNPKMLLLDEPVSALDAGARRRVRAFLAGRLLALSRPSIVVTHDARDVAALGATVCVLDAGRIVQRGKLEALRAAPTNDFVAEFVGADSSGR